MGKAIWSSYVCVFQFYDSPIKSNDRDDKKDEKELFQFYDSPIKRLNFFFLFLPTFLFQFYDSPIKSVSVPDF